MHEPLALANGMKIDPTTGRVMKRDLSFEVPTPMQAQEMVIAAKRKLVDLPDIPQKMNTVGVVLAYELFGLETIDIAIATGLSEAQVERIKSLAAFQDMRDAVRQSVLDSQTSEVRDLFTKFSREAVMKQRDLMHNAELEFVQQAAAKDILDRAGHRPADIIMETRTKQQAELTIRYIDDTNNERVDAIDITPIEGDSQ